MMNYCLFTDVSLNPELRIGVGGYIVIPESFIKISSDQIKISELEKNLILRKFENTSSTRLEIQTVLWALEEYGIGSADFQSKKLHIYTDSQCVQGLLDRRRRLESSDFHSKGGNRLLKNASLYRKFYEFHDGLKFDVTKVAGHTCSHFRNNDQRIFSYVDQKVRKELKLWVAQLKAAKADWYVYMIKCHDGAIYTGISNDVARRLQMHQEMGKKGSKYLRGRGPLKLVFQKKMGDKSSALKMERKIKNLSKSQKEIIIHNGDVD